MLLVHHAIRRLMHQAALDAGVDPDRVSFVRSLRVIRRQVASTGQAAVPPEPPARTLARIRREVAERLLPARRLRAFPRVVKRKMSNFGVKRARHRAWPQPTLPPAQAVVVVGPSKPAPVPRRNARCRRADNRDHGPTSSEPAEPT